MDDQTRQFNVIREKLECLENRDLGLVSHFNVLQDQVTNLMNEVRDNLKEIERHLWGNGRAGLFMRIDRLERSNRARQAQTRLIWGAIVAALVNAAVTWATR